MHFITANSDTLDIQTAKRADVDENNFSKLLSADRAISTIEAKGKRESLTSLPQLCRTRPYAPRVIRADVNARSLPQTIA